MTASSPLQGQPAANYSSQGGHTGSRVRKLDGGAHPGQGTPSLSDAHHGQGIRKGTSGRKTYPNLAM